MSPSLLFSTLGWRSLWRPLLAVALLLGSFGAARAQTTLYGIGTLIQDLPSFSPFNPTGATIPAGMQGLASFNPASGAPNATLQVITGLSGSQKLVGIDFRPLTGQLYALGYDPALGANNAQLYSLNPKTGLLTPISAAPITLTLGGATERIGFNFNPVADLARVVSSNDANYRISPVTGLVVTTSRVDGPLAYAAGDPNAALNPRVGGVAYTNSFAGATSTILYDAENKNDASAPSGILSTQSPPNDGTLNTQADIRLGSNNGPFFGIDAAARINIDIFWAGTYNKGYLLELTAPNGSGYSSSNLYDLSLPASLTSLPDPSNSNPAGYGSNKRTLVPANFVTPFNLLSIAVAPTPTITSLVPPSATVGTPGLTLTVNGTGFVQGSVVNYSGTARTTTYVSATQLTAALTTADLATVGTFNVTVTNPPFPGVPSAPATFTVTPVCDAPSGLAVSSTGSTTATATFTGSGAANGYTVTTTPATPTQTLAAGATSVSFTGLTPGTAYTVSIVSNCAASTTSAPATISFTTGALNPQIAVSQGGTGIANGGTFSGFASTTVGSTSAPVLFTITNASSTDALTLGAFTCSGPYALSGAAPTTSVAPGGSADFSVTFTPTAAGTNTGAVSIANNSTGNNPYVVNFSGQGTPATLPDLTVSNSPATGTPVSGNYNNVTVTGTGIALLTGPLSVAGALVVQAGGVLSQNCQLLSGPGSFELQAGASLAICDPAGIATTGPVGAVRVLGTRTFSPGASYAYNGTVAQATGSGLPATVLNLGVQNPTNVNLTQAVAVAGVLRLQSGNLNTNSQTLTLLSSAAGTALVDNLGGAVVGTATVQRYITPTINAGRGYRHYSSPVANSTVGDLGTATYTPVVNPNYNSVGNTATPFPTVFDFNESRITTSGNTPRTVDFDKGYFSPNTLGDALEVTRGYTVNIPGTELVDFVGTLNNGPLTTPALTRGSQTESGYHLRGNPYPAPLDWARVIGAGRAVNIENALYVFKSTGQYAGNYTSYVNGQSTNSGSNVLPLAQGFFVRTVAGQTGSIAFTNADRLTTPDNTPFQRGTADSRPQLTLALGNGTSRTQTVVYFEAGASADFDRAFDARSLGASSGLVLATETPTAEQLSINGQPLLTGPDVLLPLQLAAATAGTYTLAVDNLANLPTGYHAYLRDALTGTFTDLATTSSLGLSLAANTPAGGRYALLFTTQPRVLATAPAALARLASVYPNPAHGTATLLLPVALRGTAATAVSVVDNLGRTVLTRTLAAGTAETLELPLAGLAAGVYSVQARTAVGLVAKRLVVQ